MPLARPALAALVSLVLPACANNAMDEAAAAPIAAPTPTQAEPADIPTNKKPDKIKPVKGETFLAPMRAHFSRDAVTAEVTVSLYIARCMSSSYRAVDDNLNVIVDREARTIHVQGTYEFYRIDGMVKKDCTSRHKRLFTFENMPPARYTVTYDQASTNVHSLQPRFADFTAQAPVTPPLPCPAPESDGPLNLSGAWQIEGSDELPFIVRTKEPTFLSFKQASKIAENTMPLFLTSDVPYQFDVSAMSGLGQLEFKTSDCALIETGRNRQVKRMFKEYAYD